MITCTAPNGPNPQLFDEYGKQMERPHDQDVKVDCVTPVHFQEVNLALKSFIMVYIQECHQMEQEP